MLSSSWDMNFRDRRLAGACFTVVPDRRSKGNFSVASR